MDTLSEPVFATDRNRLETFEHEYLLLTLFAATNAHRWDKINRFSVFYEFWNSSSSYSKSLGNLIWLQVVQNLFCCLAVRLLLRTETSEIFDTCTCALFLV